MSVHETFDYKCEFFTKRLNIFITKKTEIWILLKFKSTRTFHGSVRYIFYLIVVENKLNEHLTRIYQIKI